jgi:hypothetical protein
MAQPFVSAIVTEGEHSLFYFDGTLSHAVVKRPKAGDFRVQEELGGSSIAATPSAALLEEAQKIVNLVEGEQLFARVDVVERPQGATLMELELIEPMLFLANHADATQRFINAIRSKLG